MNGKTNLNRILDIAEVSTSALIAFFLPVYQKVDIYLITLLGLLVLFRSFKQGFKKLPFYIFPFGLLFLMYVLGLLYTTNFDFGFREIESRMAFVILPVIYGLSYVDYKKYFRFVIWGLIIGCIGSSVVLYNNALDCYSEVGARFCFESTYLAMSMHPTYLSLIYIVGLTMLLIESFSSNSKWWYKILTLVISGYLMYFVYLFYSIGPWIASFFMVVFLLFAIFYFLKKLLYFFIITAVVTTVGVFMTLNLELLRSDYDAISTELEAYFDHPDQYIAENQNNPQSIKARIVLWNVCTDFLMEHPFGVGTGDVKEELIKYYRDNEMEEFANLKLNPHNQYLQTGGSIGWPGIILLLYAFGYYMYFGFKHKNYYLIVLISLFATACLFESILERQSGILLLIFFLSIVIPERKRTIN